ncbi:uncharacterized protein LOC133172941 isoform X1 [Saccostrea echinata]|uniref:uncharacterized protein LOC133172941 isoform X1 n=1 Tax=Saccostrea echinata TaxID=191078 RepID=UPI002A819B48|nr:uncharacterized protein LOC133172941 isoform X1 [Saccostrea echinata]
MVFFVSYFCQEPSFKEGKSFSANYIYEPMFPYQSQSARTNEAPFHDQSRDQNQSKHWATVQSKDPIQIKQWTINQCISHVELSKGNSVKKCVGEENCEISNSKSVPIPSAMLSPVTTQTKTNKRTGEKTPKTLLKMMERHRENERVRHHTLNESMKKVCERVPGYSAVMKETKVVMMQKIIAYICYLENTVHDLCEKLDLRVSDLLMSTDFITEQLRSKKALKKDNAILKHKAKSKSESKKIKVEHRGLKISSPTIDSTSDHKLVEEGYDSSQKSGIGTSVGIQTFSSIRDHHWLTSPLKNLINISGCEGAEDDPDEEGFYSQSTQGVLSQLIDTPSKLIFQNDDILPSSSCLDSFPDAFDLMSSPVCKRSSQLNSPRTRERILMNPSYGIKNDVQDYPDAAEASDGEMRTISPESVLKTNPCREDVFLSQVSEPISQHNVSAISGHSDISVFLSSPEKPSPPYTPVKSPWWPGKNKRKQYTPKRSPFNNITNLKMCPSEEEEEEEENIPEPSTKKFKSESCGKFLRRSPVDEDFVSYVPYIWKFHSTSRARRQKATHIPEKCSKDLGEITDENKNTVSKPEKIDHRKTTWMNGFMMFSRYNRKKFIEANPGVHTSHISKILGHTWRNMSAEEQKPYKDEAKLYANEMKNDNLLCPESSEEAFSSPEKLE